MKFSELKQGMTDISPGGDGGVLKRTLQTGPGQWSGVEVPERARVKIHYKLEVEEEIFLDEDPVTMTSEIDSTWVRRKAECHKIGAEERAVIAGLEIAIRTMRKGEKAQFMIDYPYAFGEHGSPRRVPKKAVILATVELVDFIEESKAVSISAKAYHRLGRARMQRKDYYETRRFLTIAQSLAPQDASVSEDLRKLDLELEAMHQAFQDFKIFKSEINNSERQNRESST